MSKKTYNYNMSLYQYQHDALKRIREMFLSVTKVCFAAACGAGKTFVAIKYIADYLVQNPGAKILVLAHGQTVLRTQFFQACEEFETVCEKLPAIFRSALVQKASDIKKCYDTHNVIVTIPQSIQHLKKLPRFDLIVVDEGHQFYFAHKGMVQRIIRKAKVKQELALTGTPSPFISHKWPVIPIPMNTLLPDYVEDVIVELAASSYLTKYDDYDLQSGELKGKNHSHILTKRATEDTLDSLLQFIHKRARSLWKKHPSIANALIKAPDWLVAFRALQKTMIACKSQKQARDVKAYFEAKGIKTLISISDDQDSKTAQDTFDRFKSDPSALILIVVGRGILGFNYPDLANVVDMTCSINIDRVFQLMSRAVRKSKKVKQKLFLKIVPDMFEGYKGQDYFHHMMTTVLSLTDEYWFTHYDGTNFLRLKIPSTRTRSGIDHTKRPTQKKRLPVAPCWIGLPAVEFFKKLWHRDRKGHYSYEFTTLGLVRRRIFDLRDNEDESNKTTTKICEWVKKNGGEYPPKPKGLIKSEKQQLGNARYSMIRAKAGKTSDRVFYESDQAIADSYGYHDIFDSVDFESESNQLVTDICKWKKSHNNEDPHQITEDPEERRLSIGLSGKRGANNGNKTTRIVYESDRKIARSYGYHNLFENTDYEGKSNGVCRRTCQWKKDHEDRDPIWGSPEYRWLQRRRKAYAGQGKGSFYDSDLEIARSFGYPTLFERRNQEHISNKRCHEVCKKIVKKGYPAKGSSDHTWIANRKLAKKDERFYQSDQEIAESYGLSSLFETKTRSENARVLEDNSNKRCHEICKWILENRKVPSSNSTDPYVKSMGAWIGGQRRAKAGNDSQGKLFYQSNQKIAESYGLPFLFTPRWTM